MKKFMVACLFLAFHILVHAQSPSPTYQMKQNRNMRSNQAAANDLERKEAKQKREQDIKLEKFRNKNKQKEAQAPNALPPAEQKAEEEKVQIR